MPIPVRANHPSSAQPSTTPAGLQGRISATSARGLSFQGKTGVEAAVALARYIEVEGTPFSGASAAEHGRALASLEAILGLRDTGKLKQATLLARSAAATCLLELARCAKNPVRDEALRVYVDAMARERVDGLQASMFSNLAALRLKVPAASKAALERVKLEVLPSQMPFDEWFKGTRRTLHTRHYVMVDFWRETKAVYRRMGFKCVRDTGGEVEFVKQLKDPNGKHKPVTARTVLVLDHNRIFRDIGDPDVQMILYSGHAQLGGVVTSSLADVKSPMKGTKFVQLFSCRGKQTVGDILRRFPGVHASATAKTSFGRDDNLAVDALYDTIARRGDYAGYRRDLSKLQLWQTSSNYILPDDARLLSLRDDDVDGIKNHGKLGLDRFYDPGLKALRGAKIDMRPSTPPGPPDALSGEKVDHAVSYANTAFYYFAEENPAAPLTQGQADHFVPDGWFKSQGDEPLRITPVKRDGETWYKVAINTRYAGQGREALAVMTLLEMQKYLCLERTGKYTENDKLRATMLVYTYVALFVDYLEDCDKVIQSAGKAYGYQGLSWSVLEAASRKDGEDRLGCPAALEVLRKQGVKVPA